MFLRKLAIVLAIATASAGAADASTYITYDLKGTLSASNYGAPFSNQPYEFSFVADRDTAVATSNGYEINAVMSAAMVSPFLFTFATPIKIGVNTFTNRFFFGSAVPGSSDAIDLQLTASQTNTLINDVTFGPQAGKAQFNFDGLFAIFGATLPPGLNFTRGSATGELSASIAAIPEASTWVMMTLGFAGVGLVARRRKRMNLQAA